MAPLSRCDANSVRLCLQEFYGDFIAVNPHLFSLNLQGVARVSENTHRSVFTLLSDVSLSFFDVVVSAASIMFA